MSETPPGEVCAREVNFDGLVGPTHNYAGLARGNLASAAHQGFTSNPRAAALEGLAKMRTLMQLGLSQAVLPPQARPNLALLAAAGFSGELSRVIGAAARHAPRLLAACYSASAMWTANAASVCPSADSEDGRVHLTPANLVSLLHRHQEAPSTEVTLRHIFGDERHFQVHQPLPAVSYFSDEGAANHTRLVGRDGSPFHLFAWGKTDSADLSVHVPRVHPARQSREASEAVARLHLLPEERTLLWQQAPQGIDEGAFHTDVLAVGNANVLLLHERAFENHEQLLAVLRQKVNGFRSCLATEAELPTADAVKGYPFNSQLVTLPNGNMRLIAPSEAENNAACSAYLARVVHELPEVEGVTYLPVRQSMANGGGPACLRLRVVLTAEERAALRGRVLLDEVLLSRLEQFVTHHYRDRLQPKDLADPALATECLQTHDELRRLLEL